MAYTFSAYLGAAGLTDVGYAFYDSTDTIIGARTTSGVVDAGSGWYSVSATAGATAVSIRWNSTGTPTAIAREYFNGAPFAANIIQVAGYTAAASAGVTFPATVSSLTSAQVDTALSTYGALKPAVAGRALDVSAGGGAGIDWSNIHNKTSTVALTNTTISGVASGGSGAYVVTVTVKTSGAVAIQNATVRLTQGASSYTAITNVSGVATFSLDAATYTRSITASGYTFTPDTIAVTAAANFNATMTTVSIPAPSNPSLCAVYGTLLAANGDPMAGAEVEFALVTANVDGSGNLVVSDTYTATADADGLIDVDLVRNDTFLYKNSHYLVTYAPMGWQKKRLVLAAASFDLTDLR